MASYTGLLLLMWASHFSGSHADIKFTARWNTPDHGYLPLPWSLEETGLGTSWSRAGFDKTLNVAMVSHNEDPRFFLLFDKQNTIAGVSFGFDKTDVNRITLQDPNFNYTFPDSMFRSSTIWEKDIWLSYVLFANPDVIRTTGRPALDKTIDDVTSELYYWADSDWRVAPRRESDVISDLVPQGCYNGMGKHYFHRTDATSSCDRWQGFFVTYDRGLLAGFGVVVFGSFISTYFTPTYYEYPDFPVVRTILPNRPACMDKWLPMTGVTSVHVFLKANAANISCFQSYDQPNNRSADSSWYSNWFHRGTSRANVDSQPSYLTTISLCVVIIYYYFLFCDN